MEDSDSKDQAQTRSSPAITTREPSPGMELHSSRTESLSHPSISRSQTTSSDMETMARRPDAPTNWGPERTNLVSRGPRPQTPRQVLTPIPRQEPMALPSIRHAVPEILQHPGAGPTSNSFSPTRSLDHSIAPYNGPFTSEPSHKRRRMSTEDDDDVDPRDTAHPRPFHSTSIPQEVTREACPPYGRASEASAFDYRYTQTPTPRTSPYTGVRDLAPMQATTRFESPRRPALPALPTLSRPGSDSRPSVMQQPATWSDYALDTARYMPSAAHSTPTSATTEYSSHPFAQQLAYGYQQPRAQSTSGHSATHPYSHERSPFSANTSYGYSGRASSGGFPYGSDPNEAGGESRQRKRRGNLPKETTDKLRAWLNDHINHPYPTEDEKQKLMAQTGLQLNQISNWFINARRRQLPTIINNARVESGATAGRSRPPTTHPRGGPSTRLGDSDEDSSVVYEDEVASNGQLAWGKRDSI